MVQVHATIPEGDNEWLDRIAEHKEMSKSKLIKRLIVRARMEGELTDKDPFMFNTSELDDSKYNA